MDFNRGQPGKEFPDQSEARCRGRLRNPSLPDGRSTAQRRKRSQILRCPSGRIACAPFVTDCVAPVWIGGRLIIRPGAWTGTRSPATPPPQIGSAWIRGRQNANSASLTMDPQTPAKQAPDKPSLQDVLLRALRIAASTVAVVELLRSHWTGGVLATLAWLLFTQVERLRGSADEPTHNRSS